MKEKISFDVLEEKYMRFLSELLNDEKVFEELNNKI